MKCFSLALLGGLMLVASILSFSQDAPTIHVSSNASFVGEYLYPATALLYSQSNDGAMEMRCTATAIEKNDHGYIFVTAAHCGCEDNVDDRTVSPEKTFFYVTADAKDEKKFDKAEVVGCGYRHKGDDFMLLQAAGDYKTVPLGQDPHLLDAVVNVASPLGLGKQAFTGTVSADSLNRPVVDGDINWTGVVLLQMFGVNGGSSGSSVICLDQKAICAFVVGSIGETTMTAMPVSRLKKLRSSLAGGTYSQWVKDPDATKK